MKEVIDLNGKKKSVPKNTTVKTIDGIHYLFLGESPICVQSVSLNR